MTRNPLFYKIFYFISLLLAFCIIQNIAFAYDFEPIAKAVKKTVSIKQPDKSLRLAIVYSEKSRQNVQSSINLISFKKELTESLAKIASLADPITVNQLKTKYNLTYSNIASNSDKMKEFAARMEANQVLLVHLFMDRGKLRAIFTLCSSDRAILTKVQWEFQPEKRGGSQHNDSISYYANNDQSQGSTANNLDESEKKAGKFFTGIGSSVASYLRRTRANKANTSWLITSPTAYVQPKSFYVQGTIWVDDITKPSLPLSRLRFGYLLLPHLSVGTTAIGGRSPYALFGNIKFQLLHLQSGLAVAIGFRNRFILNKGYPIDSSSRKISILDSRLITEQTRHRGARTLQLAITQSIFNESLLANFYLDNELMSFGSQVFVFPWMAFSAEEIIYYYAENTAQPLIALHVFQGLKELSFNVAYNFYSQKPTFNMGYNW